MSQKNPEKVKKEIEKLKREYQKFEVKISQLKKEQTRLIKKIMEKSDQRKLAKIKRELIK
jgi:hypothetical protein